MSPSRVLEAVLYAPDLAAEEKFFVEVLGLRPLSPRTDLSVFFRVGRSMLLVFDPRVSRREGRAAPAHGASGPGHVCLAIGEAEYDRWVSRLREKGVAIEREVGWPGGGRSIYFRDPAGNSIELGTERIWYQTLAGRRAGERSG